LLASIRELVERIDETTITLAGVIRTLHEEAPDELEVKKFLEKRDEIMNLVELSFDAYVATQLSKLQRAKKLALYCIADSQRIHTDLALALFIDAPRDQINRQIVQAIGSEFHKRGVP